MTNETQQVQLIIHGLTGGIGTALYQHAVEESRYFQVHGTTREECDVANADLVDRYYANLVNINGVPGCPLYVINATGVLENALLAKVTDEQWERVRGTSLDGVFNVSRAFASVTRERPGSSLLHLSSVVARKRLPGTALYSMGKGAIHGIVPALAAELGKYDVRVNAIEMGYFDTGMITKVPKAVLDQIIQETPLRRLGRTIELWTICWEVLKNSFATGAVVPLTGGL